MPESTYSLSFNGSGGKVTAAGNVLAGSFTLACWFRPNFPVNGSTDASFIHRFTGANGYTLQIFQGLLTAVSANASLRVSQGITQLTQGTWYHCAAVNDGVNLIVFLDGVQEGTASTINPADSGGTLTFGARSDFAAFTECNMDDIGIWATNLSGTDIADLATGTKFPQDFPTGLVGLWHLEEGTGATTADSSGNGNTGTFSGGVTWSADVPSQLAGGGGGGGSSVGADAMQYYLACAGGRA